MPNLQERAFRIITEIAECHTKLKELKDANRTHYNNCHFVEKTLIQYSEDTSWFEYEGDSCVKKAFDNRRMDDVVNFSNVCPSCMMAVLNFAKSKDLRRIQGNARRRIHTLARQLKTMEPNPC